MIFAIANPKLIVKGVVPEMVHVVPVTNDSILHRVRHLEQRTDVGSFISYHDVFEFRLSHFLFRAEHRPANDCWEDRFGEIRSGEATFDKLNVNKY